MTLARIEDVTAGFQAAGAANKARKDEIAATDDKAEEGKAAAVPHASYAAALVAPKPLPQTRISAIVKGRLVEWVRKAGGPCLGGGWVPSGDCTPYHFDAVGDGVANDGPAVQAWLSFVIANNLEGYVPAGDYLLDSAASVAFSGKRFSIIGCGVGASRFIVTSNGGGLLMDATDRASQFTGKDFSLVARGTSRGTGLRFTLVPGGNQHQRSVILDNVEVKGENIASDCFDKCIDLTGNWRPLVRGCVTGGPFGPGASDDLTDASPMFVGTAGLVIDHCYDPSIENCHIWSAHTGISARGTDQEAIRLTNTVVNGVRVALDFYRTTREPIVWIDNCHFNYRDDGLKIDGARLVIIRGSHPYNEDLAANYTGTPRDIWLKNTERVILANNIFHFAGHPNRINVFFDATTYANGLICQGNIFGAVGAEAIRIGAGASNIHIADNQYPGTYGVRVNDLSSGAVISERTAAGEYTIEGQADSNASSPILNLYRNSDSPAVNDALASFKMRGNDSAGNVTDYATVRATITNPNDGAEAGEWQFFALLAGALSRQLTVGNGVQVGSPTGGSKGPGTLNVQGSIYANNVADVSGSYTSQDGKTITVTNGIITGIA